MINFDDIHRAVKKRKSRIRKEKVFAKAKDLGGAFPKATTDLKTNLSKTKAPSAKKLGMFPVKYF